MSLDRRAEAENRVRCRRTYLSSLRYDPGYNWQVNHPESLYYNIQTWCDTYLRSPECFETYDASFAEGYLKLRRVRYRKRRTIPAHEFYLSGSSFPMGRLLCLRGSQLFKAAARRHAPHLQQYRQTSSCFSPSNNRRCWHSYSQRPSHDMHKIWEFQVQRKWFTKRPSAFIFCAVSSTTVSLMLHYT